jgi:hypothetical protein
MHSRGTFVACTRQIHKAIENVGGRSAEVKSTSRRRRCFGETKCLVSNEYVLFARVVVIP